MDNTPTTIRPPSTAYARARPRVYNTPDRSTIRGFSRRLLMNDMAAILVARGQGLMDVRMPNQRADPRAQIVPSIIRPHKI